MLNIIFDEFENLLYLDDDPDNGETDYTLNNIICSIFYIVVNH